MALFRHERIITTLPKAKAVRPFIEKLITLAKKGTLHARRLAIARLGPSGNAEVKPPEGDDDGDVRTIIQKLFSEIGPRFQDRPGGYTRVIKRHERRLGDGGKTAFLELLKEGETRSRASARSSPGPSRQGRTRRAKGRSVAGNARNPTARGGPGRGASARRRDTAAEPSHLSGPMKKVTATRPKSLTTPAASFRSP